MKKEVLIYQSKSGKIEFQADLKKDTICGTLNQISALFRRDKSVISRHIKNIFKSLELQRDATVAKIATVVRNIGESCIYWFNFKAVGYVYWSGLKMDGNVTPQTPLIRGALLFLFSEGLYSFSFQKGFALSLIAGRFGSQPKQIEHY